MKIATSQTTPTTQELVDLLNKEVSTYSAYRFGLGPNKTVLIKKSAFVGVQITNRHNEITIEGTLPSPLLSILSSLLFIEGFGYIFGYAFFKQWKKMENEIGDLLKLKYS